MKFKGMIAELALAGLMISCGGEEKKAEKETVKIGSKKTTKKMMENL